MKPRPVAVSDLMTTALVTLRPQDRVEQADLDMRAAGIRHIPIVDERNHVIGIVSSRDLARALAEHRLTAPLEQIMQRIVFTVTPETPAEEAAALMAARKIGALPVVGDDEELVGIVTETDFLRLACRALRGEPMALS